MKIPRTVTAYQVKDRNSWRAYGINPATHLRLPYYGSTKEEAEKAALGSYRALAPGETLADFYFNSYLPTVIGTSKNWKNQIGWAMDKHILPVIGHLPLTHLKRPQLQALFNRIHLAPSSQGRVRIVLSGVLNLAVADEMIPTNLCRFVKLPKAGEPDKIALTYDQLAKLYLAARSDVKVFILLSGVAAGLRIGEVCGTSRMLLTSDDVLHVRQQVLQLKGGSELTKKLKTPQTRREVPLPHALAEQIRADSFGGFYLAGRAGKSYPLPNNLTKYLALATKKAKVPAISPHELRHTIISLLENELEAPAAVVAAIVGKKDKRVTGGYSHTHREQIVRTLSEHFERFSKQVEMARAVLESETQAKTG